MSLVDRVTGWASASHCRASSNRPREPWASPALVSRVAIGAARATPSATSSARPTTSSATSLIRPHVRASSAVTTRPV